MTFEELRKIFEGEIVSDEEFELLNNFSEVEFNRVYSEPYRLFYEYTAISENNDDYFNFYQEIERI